MNNLHWNKRIAIVGLGETKIGAVPDKNSLQLYAEASKKAIEDAGLSKNDIDGVLTAGTYMHNYLMHSMVISEYLHIRPQYSSTVLIGGVSAVHMISSAAAAINMGLCKTVLVVAADSLLSEGRSKAVEMMAGFCHPQYELPFGFITPSMYALAATRHMYQYGTTREQLAQVAVSMRKHASLNPNAHYRKKITIEDVIKSKPISSPLNLLDCAPVSDGGAALIVTTEERARELTTKPIYLLGVGEAHDLDHADWQRDITVSAARRAGQSAYAMAGLGPRELDFAQIYDCFTITLIALLEDLGFCGKGEGGPFVGDGSRIELGGEIPVNTHGGLLSQGHAGPAAGIFHVTEAVKQLRGNVDVERQVANANVGLVYGNGGMLRSGAALILGRNYC